MESISPKSSDARAKSGLAFIPARLDDYGLEPTPFRIYCHIARRAGECGDCWEKVQTISETTGLHEDTIRPALKLLVLRGLLQATERPGQTTIYNLTPTSAWKPSENGQPPRKKRRGISRRGQAEKFGGESPENFSNHPPEKFGVNGSPLMVPPDVSPNKGEAPRGFANKIYPKEAIEGAKLCRQKLEELRGRLQDEYTPEKKKPILDEIQRVKAALAGYESTIIELGQAQGGTTIATEPVKKKAGNGPSQIFNPRLQGLDMEQVRQQSNDVARAVEAMAAKRRAKNAEEQKA